MYINLKIKVSYLIVGVLLLGSLILGGIVLAGDPDSTGEPSATSSYSLEDLYQRLAAGTVGSSSVFTEPTTAPGTGTMHTINEIMSKAPVLDNTNGATTTQVISGTTFWGLTASQWATQTGTMTNNGVGSTIVPTTTNQSVAAGYWSSANTVQGDSDLIAGNIKQGTGLFGVDGTLYNAGVPKTGITATLVVSDDGDLEMGVAWPNPRFTDNGDETVTDNLTGLMWMKDANVGNDCDNVDIGKETWANAMTSAAACNTNSVAGYTDWRLPNLRELQSLMHYGVWDGGTNAVIPNTAGTGQWSEGDPFTSVQADYYWSSSIDASEPSAAWYVYMLSGRVNGNYVTNPYYVWPVRGGQ